MKKILVLASVIASCAMLASCDMITNKFKEDAKKELEEEYELKLELAEAKAEAEAAKKEAAEAKAAAESAAESAEMASRRAAVKPVQKSRSNNYAVSSADQYAWLSQRRVTASDLSGLSGSDLRILRNAIYARHGYIFKSADLRNYFSSFSWYHPSSHDVSGRLNSIEKYNIAEIQRWE